VCDPENIELNLIHRLATLHLVEHHLTHLVEEVPKDLLTDVVDHPRHERVVITPVDLVVNLLTLLEQLCDQAHRDRVLPEILRVEHLSFALNAPTSESVRTKSMTV
tara:strand:- start:797 stop:1114 length:318 start_codon:yes stop_codon:yes gene_type:complete